MVWRYKDQHSRPETQPRLENKLKEEERTFLSCHNCGKSFLALLDKKLDGCHIVNCPWCGHLHARHIVDGRVTDKRWDTIPQPSDIVVSHRNVWKHDSEHMQTSSVSVFLQEMWLERSEE